MLGSSLSTFYQPYIGDILLETLPYTFANLRSLFLSTHFEMYGILSTFCLLRNAPNLEDLEIVIINNQEQETEANAEFQNTQWTDGMCASLHVVKINDISCFLNEMCFIELVLSKATALRKMSISLGDECIMSEENALSKLYTYRRASPSAQVFFEGKNTLRQGHRGATGNSRGSGQDPHPEWSHQAKTGKAPNAPSRCIVIWRRLPNGPSSINFPPKQTTITYLLGKIPEQGGFALCTTKPRSQKGQRCTIPTTCRHMSHAVGHTGPMVSTRQACSLRLYK